MKEENSKNGTSKKSTSKVPERKPLWLLKADYKEVMTSDGERRKFLSVKDVTENDIFDDVNNGAAIFMPLAEHIDKNELRRRVRFIKAESLENGLKAVEYLAPQDAIADGFELDDYSYLENSGTTIAELKSSDIENSQTRFPIVSANEALNEGTAVSGLPFGGYSLNFTAAGEKKDPYYNRQKTGPIVIIHNPDLTMVPINMTDVLNIFPENRRIYVIWLDTCQIFTEYVEPSLVGENEDPELLNLIINHDASLFCLDDERAEEVKYIGCLIENIVAKNGMTIKKGFDIEKLAEVVFECSFEGFKADFAEKLLKRSKESSDVVDEGILKMLGKPALWLIGNEKGSKVLETMVGMEDVKKQLDRYLDSLAFSVARRKGGIATTPPTTMLMLGGPGTGKTECAKAVAHKAAEKHLIANSNVTVITGTELNAEYLGQTRTRVQSIFAQARGGVLFIDEAYSLSDGTKGETDLYSRQAIAQMLVELDRIATTGDTIVIFAGYEDRMQKFLEANPGLRSRCSSCVIRFSSYNEEQAADIFYGICRREGFSTEAIDNVPKVRENLVGYFKRVQTQKSYGNGRTVRNLFLQAESEMATRIAREGRSKPDLNTLLPEDVIAAVNASLDMMSSDGSQHISFIK